MNVQNNVFCIDNSAQGIVLYRLDSSSLQKTFPVKATTPEGTAQPKQVALTECRAVISGSDHGVVYIFDWKTGDTINELTIQPGMSFQTVSVSILLASDFTLNP